MKKRVLGVLGSLLCVVMLFSACDFSTLGSSEKETTYTVTFLNYDNSILYRVTDIKEGEPAIYGGETPTRPDSSEYTYSFIGWDKDISAIYSNLSVFAKYSETSKTGDNANTGKDPNGIVMSASILSDSSYSYQPNTKVTEDTPYDLLYSYRDDDNYYYGFNLGTVKNVIVDDTPYSIRYMGPANIKRTYTTSRVSSTSIENQSSWLKQRLEYDNKLAGESAGLEIGILDIFSVKASASVQYYSNTTTTTNSSGETVKQEVTETESQSIEITFDSTCPYGDYRISHVMDYDVFAIVTKAIKGEITINIMALPRKGIIELYEYSVDGFADVKLPELEFDSSIIDSLPIPTDYIKSGDDGGDTSWSMLSWTMERVCCKLDNNYDERTKGNDDSLHSNFELGHLEIYGCSATKDNKLKLMDKNAFHLYYRVDQIVDKIKYSGNALSQITLKVSSDTAKQVMGTNIKNKQIGMGAYYVRVTYHDNSMSEWNSVDIFNGINKGSYLDIVPVSEINHSKEITRIEITVAYELVYSIKGPNINVSTHYNYKCTQVFNFD